MFKESYFMSLMKMPAYKHKKTRYNVISKTQNDVFEEIALYRIVIANSESL